MTNRQRHWINWKKNSKKKPRRPLKIAEGNSDKSGVAYVSTKNKLRIEELRVKKQEYMSELVKNRRRRA